MLLLRNVQQKHGTILWFFRNIHFLRWRMWFFHCCDVAKMHHAPQPSPTAPARIIIGSNKIARKTTIRAISRMIQTSANALAPALLILSSVGTETWNGVKESQ